MAFAKNKTEMLQSLLDREQPRAFDKLSFSCTYDHSVNGGCAIGCQIQKSLAKDLGRGSLEVVFTFLPKRLRDMGIDFLRDIQDIHDLENNYNEDGIGWNEKGLKQIENLANHHKIKLDFSKYESKI